MLSKAPVNFVDALDTVRTFATKSMAYPRVMMEKAKGLVREMERHVHTVESLATQ